MVAAHDAVDLVVAAHDEVEPANVKVEAVHESVEVGAAYDTV